MYRRGRLIPTYRPSPTSEGRAACAVRTPLLIVRGFAPDALPEACSPFTKTNTGILSYSGHTGPSSPLAHLPISPSDDQHLQIQGILFWPRYVCGGGVNGLPLAPHHQRHADNLVSVCSCVCPTEQCTEVSTTPTAKP